MMLQQLLVALAVSIALADPQAADSSALRGTPEAHATPPEPPTAATAEGADDEDSYIERDLVKDEGNKTLADVESVDLKTCALFCDALPSCNSFSYTSQEGGHCYLKAKIVNASDEAATAQEQKGFRTYYKDKQVQEVKEESEKPEGKESEEGSTADEEVPTSDLNKVYHDLDGISSTWGNFIVCRGGRVCRGGWSGGVCRGGFVCRQPYYGRGRYGGGGGCQGVRVCRGGWRGGVCRGGFYCRRYR